MAFYESPRFPDRISYGVTGGPGWRTQVAESLASFEQRNGAWVYPRHRWDVSQGLNAPAAFEALRAFFMTMRGRLHGWRFKDWADYMVEFGDAVESGVVQGLTTTTVQLVKRYTSGSQTLDRQIRKPIASGFTLKDSGVALATPADYTLDTTTGVVTTTVPRTAANLTWGGEFDVPCRFDTDDLRSVIVARNGQGLVTEWSGIPIVEIRV